MLGWHKVRYSKGSVLLQRVAAYCSVLLQGVAACRDVSKCFAASDVQRSVEGVVAKPMRTNTATYCNIMQHTATHCNPLQQTVTHCKTLQHTATLEG